MNLKKNEIRNYPLKLIEMDYFLQNSDHLLQNRTNDDLQEMRHTRKCLNNTDSKYTLLFIDSDKYRQHFEKTHLKLKNNIIVLDRHINFQTLDELYQFYNLFYNSKYWLLHGTLKCSPEGETKELKRKSNQIIDKYSDNSDKNTELLLVLNSDDSYVRPILENAFTKLINNFSNSFRSTFEINYESILKSYLMRKFQNNEPLFKLEELKSNLKLIRYNVIFTASVSTKTQFDLIDCNNSQDKALLKIGNILNRLKNVISNKPNKTKPFCDVSNHQNNHTEFSIDLLPSLFYYRDDDGITFNCVSFNQDQFKRTHLRKARNRSPKQDNMNIHNLEISNRFQTYIIRSRSKFKNYDKINDVDKVTSEPCNFYSSIESKLSNEDTKKESESTVNSSMSSLSSSISNYINKKKRLTKSTSFNFAFENIDVDGEKLIDDMNDLEPNKSNESVVVFNSEDFNFDYTCKHETKSQDCAESNRHNYVIDEKILRHPALVKQNLKSKSFDLMETEKTSLENNLKQQVPAKTKYRKNSKLVHSNSKQVAKLEEIESKRTSVNSTSSNENRFKVATVNNYKIKKLTTQKPTAKETLYTKLFQRQSRSPPPPISLSPTGLLAPPPLPSPNSVLQKQVANNSFNYLQPLTKIDSESNSINYSSYSHLIKNNNINNYENDLRSKNSNENTNYNHLYLKKFNENEKRANAHSNIKKRLYLEQTENFLVGSKLDANCENNRFRINSYNLHNTEKVF